MAILIRSMSPITRLVIVVASFLLGAYLISIAAKLTSSDDYIPFGAEWWARERLGEATEERGSEIGMLNHHNSTCRFPKIPVVPCTSISLELIFQPS